MKLEGVLFLVEVEKCFARTFFGLHVPSRSEGIETPPSILTEPSASMCLHVPSRSEGMETHDTKFLWIVCVCVYTCLPVRRELKLNTCHEKLLACIRFTRAFPFGGNRNDLQTGAILDSQSSTRAFPFGGNRNIMSQSRGLRESALFTRAFPFGGNRNFTVMAVTVVFTPVLTGLHVPSRSEGIETQVSNFRSCSTPSFTRAFPFGGNRNSCRHTVLYSSTCSFTRAFPFGGNRNSVTRI